MIGSVLSYLRTMLITGVDCTSILENKYYMTLTMIHRRLSAVFCVASCEGEG